MLLSECATGVLLERQHGTSEVARQRIAKHQRLSSAYWSVVLWQGCL